VLLCSIYLVIAPIIDSPDILYLIATLFMLAGLIFYFPLVALNKHIKSFGECFILLYYVILLAYVIPISIYVIPISICYTY